MTPAPVSLPVVFRNSVELLVLPMVLFRPRAISAVFPVVPFMIVVMLAVVISTNLRGVFVCHQSNRCGNGNQKREAHQRSCQ